MTSSAIIIVLLQQPKVANQFKKCYLSAPSSSLLVFLLQLHVGIVQEKKQIRLYRDGLAGRSIWVNSQKSRLHEVKKTLESEYGELYYSMKQRQNSFDILIAFFVRQSSDYETLYSDRMVNRYIYIYIYIYNIG